MACHNPVHRYVVRLAAALSALFRRGAVAVVAISCVVADDPAAGQAGGGSTWAFLSGGDTMTLWRQTVSHALAEAPIAHLRSPLTGVSPPIDGLIETEWVRHAAEGPSPPAQQRAILHFVPVAGGAWLETSLETTAPPPGSADIPTMPPAYPNTWAPLAVPQHPALARAFRKVGSDYANFYSCESLVCVTAAFGAGALMANTGFDTTMQNAWQQGVAPTGLGTFFSDCKPMGEGRYALPIFGAAAVTGLIFDDSGVGNVVGEWGSRSLRMFLVGAPPLYVLQLATGASRPSDGYGSQWHFFNDNNGVSGHAFIGAIPFLAAADMVESPLLKGTLYVFSTFTGFSRMTDNAHYPSQVFLGWYLAWASSVAVSRTELSFEGMRVQVVPLPMADLGGLAIETRW